MLFHLLKLNLKPLPTDEEEAGPPVATRKGVLVGGLVLAAVLRRATSVKEHPL